MPNDDNDIMINRINHMKKKETEAKYIIDRITPYLNGVKAVDSLENLLKDCKAETLIDRIYEYFKNGGEIIDFYDILGEQRKEYIKNSKGMTKNNVEKIYNNSLKSHGAKPQKAVIKKKRISKLNYKALLLSLIMTITLLVPASFVIKDIIEEMNFASSIETIEESYLIEKGYSLSASKKLDIYDLSNFDVIDFGNYLKTLDLSEHSIIYITYILAGPENANKLCHEFYFASFDKILRDDFPKIHSTGYKEGDIKQLENHCQREITEKGLEINQILENYDIKSIGGKH